MEEYFDKEIDFDSLRLKSNNHNISLIEGVSYKKIIELNNILKEYPKIKKSIKYKGRYYPKRNLASQLIGKFSHKKNNEGLWGIEYAMNSFLEGRTDKLSFFLTSTGRKKRDFSK